MTIYNILGIEIDIPNLSDIEQAIVSPVESFFAIAQSTIISSILNGLSYIQNLGSTISSTVQQTILPAISNFFAPVVSFIQSIPQQLANFATASYQALLSFGQQVQTAINGGLQNIGSLLNQYIVTPLNSFFAQVSAQIGGGFGQLSAFVSTQGQQLQAFFINAGNQIRQEVSAAIQLVQGQLVQLGQSLGSVAQFVSLSFNQLGVSIQSGFTQFASAASNFGASFVIAIQELISKEVAPALQQIQATLQNGITFATNTLRRLFAASPSPDPQEALNQILLEVETVAVGSLAVYGGLAIIENLNPLSNLRLTETYKKILEIAGIAELPHFITSLALNTGFGTQIRYFFNYNIQPVRVAVQTAKRGLYYQKSDISKVSEALRYEGYNSEAIDLELATVYEPLPVRMITKFIDNGIIDDDLIYGELLKNGIDPIIANRVLQSLKLLKVSQYQASAKQIISTIYKNGYLNEKLATDTLALVGTPPDQIQLVLYLARLTFQDEQVKEIETTILDQVKKLLIKPEDAIAALIELGLDEKRANVKVKLAAVVGSPNPSKSERAALIDAALSIPVTV